MNREPINSWEGALAAAADSDPLLRRESIIWAYNRARHHVASLGIPITKGEFMDALLALAEIRAVPRLRDVISAVRLRNAIVHDGDAPPPEVCRTAALSFRGLEEQVRQTPPSTSAITIDSGSKPGLAPSDPRLVGTGRFTQDLAILVEHATSRFTAIITGEPSYNARSGAMIYKSAFKVAGAPEPGTIVEALHGAWIFTSPLAEHAVTIADANRMFRVKTLEVARVLPNWKPSRCAPSVEIPLHMKVESEGGRTAVDVLFARDENHFYRAKLNISVSNTQDL